MDIDMTSRPGFLTACRHPRHRLFPLPFGVQPTCEMKREAQWDVLDNVFYTAACLFARSLRRIRAYQRWILRHQGVRKGDVLASAVWPDTTRHVWNETDNRVRRRLCGEQKRIFVCSLFALVWLKCETSRLAMWFTFARVTWPGANSPQRARLSVPAWPSSASHLHLITSPEDDICEPERPLPTSQHRADCKCYRGCQVESIFVSDMGSPVLSKQCNAEKPNSGLPCWPQIWEFLAGPSKLSAGRLVFLCSGTKESGPLGSLMGHHPLVFGMQVSNLRWSFCSPCLATGEASLSGLGRGDGIPASSP